MENEREKKSKLVIVALHDESVRETEIEWIRDIWRHDVIAAQNPEEALDMLVTQNADAMLADANFGNRGSKDYSFGVRAYRTAKEKRTAIVLVTGNDVSEVINAGVPEENVLGKPYRPNILKGRLGL
jgi:DNA-binding response OmpR family regulator